MQTNFRSRLGALIRKEFNQIRRDRRLAMSLIVPPTLQLLLFGFALDSNVSNLRLGVVDDARSPESREVSDVMSQSKSFRLAGTYSSAGELGKAISLGQLDAGLVIPYDFSKEFAARPSDYRSDPAERRRREYSRHRARLCRGRASELQLAIGFAGRYSR